MPELGTQAWFLRRVLIVAAVFSAVALLWRIADVLPVLFGGILLALALRGLSNPLRRWTGLPDALALTLVILVLLALLGVGGWLLGDQLANQAVQLSDQIPAAIARLRATVEQWPAGNTLLRMLNVQPEDGAKLRTQFAGWIGIGVNAVVKAILILGIGIYTAYVPDLYRRGAVRLFPPHLRPAIDETLSALTKALREWLLGQVITMAAMAALVATGLWLLDVPLALSLGVLAGLVEFIPYLGPILSSIPGILIAFTQGPMLALYAMLMYLLVHQTENHVLQPLVQRWATRLPPALGILAVAVFGLLFGTIGLLFAVPAMVVVMVVVERLYVRRVLEKM